MKPQKVGLLPLTLSVLMLLAGCASQPQQVPVAVACPESARPPQELMQPPKALYLLPKESLPIVRKTP